MENMYPTPLPRRVSSAPAPLQRSRVPSKMETKGLSSKKSPNRSKIVQWLLFAVAILVAVWSWSGTFGIKNGLCFLPGLERCDGTDWLGMKKENGNGGVSPSSRMASKQRVKLKGDEDYGVIVGEMGASVVDMEDIVKPLMKGKEEVGDVLKQLSKRDEYATAIYSCTDTDSSILTADD